MLAKKNYYKSSIGRIKQCNDISNDRVNVRYVEELKKIFWRAIYKLKKYVIYQINKAKIDLFNDISHDMIIVKREHYNGP